MNSSWSISVNIIVWALLQVSTSLVLGILLWILPWILYWAVFLFVQMQALNNPKLMERTSKLMCHEKLLSHENLNSMVLWPKTFFQKIWKHRPWLSEEKWLWEKHSIVVNQHNICCALLSQKLIIKWSRLILSPMKHGKIWTKKDFFLIQNIKNHKSTLRF